MDILNIAIIVFLTCALFYMLGLRYGSRERDQLRKELQGKENYIATMGLSDQDLRSGVNGIRPEMVRFSWEKPLGKRIGTHRATLSANAPKSRKRPSGAANRTKVRRLKVGKA